MTKTSDRCHVSIFFFFFFFLVRHPLTTVQGGSGPPMRSAPLGSTWLAFIPLSPGLPDDNVFYDTSRVGVATPYDHYQMIAVRRVTNVIPKADWVQYTARSRTTMLIVADACGGKC